MKDTIVDIHFLSYPSEHIKVTDDYVNIESKPEDDLLDHLSGSKRNFHRSCSLEEKSRATYIHGIIWNKEGLAVDERTKQSVMLFDDYLEVKDDGCFELVRYTPGGEENRVYFEQ